MRHSHSSFSLVQLTFSFSLPEHPPSPLQLDSCWRRSFLFYTTVLAAASHAASFTCSPLPASLRRSQCKQTLFSNLFFLASLTFSSRTASIYYQILPTPLQIASPSDIAISLHLCVLPFASMDGSNGDTFRALINFSPSTQQLALFSHCSAVVPLSLALYLFPRLSSAQ